MKVRNIDTHAKRCAGTAATRRYKKFFLNVLPSSKGDISSPNDPASIIALSF